MHTLRHATAAAAAAALALGPTAIAHAEDGGPLQPTSDFPAVAQVTVAELSHRSAPHSADYPFEVWWGQASSERELGADRLAADLSDPHGITDYITVGHAEGLVGTTAAGSGRAEASVTISDGFSLALPEFDVPVIEFAALRNSVSCDFRGNVTWENTISSEEGKNDGAFLVFGTPVEVDRTLVKADVPLPGTESVAKVTIQTANPETWAPYHYVFNQIEVTTEDGVPLAYLSPGTAYVDCGIADPDYEGGPVPSPGG